MAVASVTKASGDTVGAAERNALREDILRHAGDVLTDTGAANAYIVTCDNQITSLAEGQIVKFIPDNTNTSAATLRFKNSLILDVTDAIVVDNAQALYPGELRAGELAICEFNGTDWVLLNPRRSAYRDALRGLRAPDSELVIEYSVQQMTKHASTTAEIVREGISESSMRTSAAADAAGLYIKFFEEDGDTQIVLGDSVKFGVAGSFRTPDAQYRNLWFGFSEETGLLAPGSATFTTAHAGFFIEGSTVWATVANGTTQTKTNITGFLPDINLYSLFEVYFNGTAFEFYIDGVLATTIGTNIPARTALEGFGLVHDSDDGSSVNTYMKNKFIVRAGFL